MNNHHKDKTLLFASPQCRLVCRPGNIFFGFPPIINRRYSHVQGDKLSNKAIKMNEKRTGVAF